jgi:uncharacterized membrane protein YbjE (DUF340 family)
MELGIYSFGDVQWDSISGALGSTAEAMRNLREAIALADAVGLDYFGVGEHHTDEMLASAGAVIFASAASITKRIKLGSAVTVLSTDDPVRVYQQFATLDATNSVLSERIDWLSFVVIHIAAGTVAGFVVSHSERIRTWQHLPFLNRAGIEQDKLIDRSGGSNA